MHVISIGSDPETFLVDSMGKYVSGHDLIPGTKHEPYPVNKGAIQRDGTALEFNINPAMSSQEFIENIETVMKEMEKHYKIKRPDLTIALTPTAYFEKEYFDTLPFSATELGCTPDFNAYSGLENEPPHTDEPFRTGSGHVHVGWCDVRVDDEDHFDLCRYLVKNLDASLYPASILWDKDTKRRELYGKIGAFRPKSYGVEYRPLSNAYLRDKEIQSFVFDMTKAVSDLVLNSGADLLDNVVLDTVIQFRNDASLSDTQIRKYMNYLNNCYNLPHPENYGI